MSTESTLAVQERPFVKASSTLSLALGIETGMMIDTIKAQCFKSVTPDKVTDEQLAAYISVCNALPGINPLLPGMLYAYPEKNGGIQPIIGPDGIYTLLASNREIVAQKNGEAAWGTEHGKEGDEDICTAFINHITKGLLKKKIYVKEWIVDSNLNWKTRRRHMSEIRALKQCARQIIHGLPMDEDERKIAEMVNVTHTAEASDAPVAERTDPAKLRRGRQGASAAKEQAIDIPATTTAETPAAAPAAEPAKVAEPAAVAPVEAAVEATKPEAPKVRTKVEENEVITVNVRLKSAKYENFNAPDKAPMHGCLAEVQGEFLGSIYDLGGGVEGGTLKPVWQSKGPLLVTVKGRKSGRGVIPIVQKVELAPAPDAAAEEPLGLN